MGDGADQKTRSKAGQILWVSDIQVQDAPGQFTRSIRKFAISTYFQLMSVISVK